MSAETLNDTSGMYQPIVKQQPKQWWESPAVMAQLPFDPRSGRSYYSNDNVFGGRGGSPFFERRYGHLRGQGMLSDANGGGSIGGLAGGAMQPQQQQMGPMGAK